MAPFGQRHHLELVMVDQEHCDFASSHSFIYIQQFSSILGKLSGELPKIGLDYLDARTVFLGKVQCNLKRRALPQIVDVRFEGDAAAGYIGVWMVFYQRDGTLNCRSCFMIVYLATRPHNARKIRGGIDDEPGINSNAVTTHARSRSQHIDPRMAICQVNDFPHIYAKAIADERKLIRKCDIRISEGIFSQLHQLGCAGRGCYARSTDERFIETLSLPRARRSDAANAAIIVNKFCKNSAW
jgi:hypothetical protein